LKGASTVRRGAVGNVLSDETTRKDFGMSKELNSNALAAYSTVPPERKDWLTRTQRQEDAMAEQTTTAVRNSLP
jgi:hypothetical protein